MDPNVEQRTRLSLYLAVHPDVEWQLTRHGNIRGLYFSSTNIIQFRISWTPVLEIQRRRGSILLWNQFEQQLRASLDNINLLTRPANNTMSEQTNNNHGDFGTVLLDETTLNNLWSMIVTHDPHLATEAWAHLSMLSNELKNQDRIKRKLQNNSAVIREVLSRPSWQWELRLWCLITLDSIFTEQWVDPLFTRLAQSLSPSSLRDRRAIRILRKHFVPFDMNRPSPELSSSSNNQTPDPEYNFARTACHC